jgi:hypothetical protein
MRIARTYILVASLLILALMLAACSHVVFPLTPIPVEMDKVGPINTTKAIALVNGQTESKLTLVTVLGSDKYFADFKQWGDFVVAQLRSELEKRKVQVKPQGDYAFKVSVTNVRFFKGAFAIRCIVNVQLDRSDGKWSKTFEGNNAGGDINRAIDGAVYKAVAAIIGDLDFQRALSE